LSTRLCSVLMPPLASWFRLVVNVSVGRRALFSSVSNSQGLGFCRSLSIVGYRLFTLDASRVLSFPSVVAFVIAIVGLCRYASESLPYHFYGKGTACGSALSGRHPSESLLNHFWIAIVLLLSFYCCRAVAVVLSLLCYRCHAVAIVLSLSCCRCYTVAVVLSLSL
jgi:hypothetical protein